MPRFLEQPTYAPPALTPKQARSELQGWLEGFEKEYRGLGIEWDKAARSEAIYRFRGSELFCGPRSAATWAGWCARELRIQTKDAFQNATLQPFKVNAVQWAILKGIFEDLEKRKLIRYPILKARQFGVSTLCQAIAFEQVTLGQHLNALTLAHKKEATDTITEIVRRYHRNLRHAPRFKRASRQELEMAEPSDCRFRLGTAEASEVGRGGTNQVVHASEVAFWRDAKTTRLGLMQTVPDAAGTMVFEESTANGMGGVFHTNYMLGKRGTSNLRSWFFPWHCHEQYEVKNLTKTQEFDILAGLDEDEKWQREAYDLSAGQILWRRFVMEEKCDNDVLRFNQEYPHNDVVAFLTSGTPVFDLDIVSRRLETVRELPPLFQGAIHP